MYSFWGYRRISFRIINPMEPLNEAHKFMNNGHQRLADGQGQLTFPIRAILAVIDESTFQRGLYNKSPV